jgi:hypothetical protein
MKKKIIYGICMMALVAVVATSCKKKEEAVSFTAEIAILQDGDGDRMYINPVTYVTKWAGNEQVKIYNINDANPEASVTQVYQVTQAGASSPIVGSGIGYNSTYYAFCPAEMATADLEDGNYQVFEIMDNQPLFVNPTEPGQYLVTVSGTSLPMAATCSYSNPYFPFKHIFGIVRFRFKCDPYTEDGSFPKYRKLESMTIEDPYMNLSGSVKLKPHKINETYLSEIMEAYKAGQEFANIDRYQSYVLSHTGEGLGYSAEGGGHTITYDLTDLGGIQFRPDVEYVTVLVGIRPGALAKGFNVSLDIHEEGADPAIRTINLEFPAKRSKVMEPNTVKGYTMDITHDVDSIFGHLPEPR